MSEELQTAEVMAVDFLIWMIAIFSVYSRMNYNFMHGNEFGVGRDGDSKTKCNLFIVMPFCI